MWIGLFLFANKLLLLSDLLQNARRSEKKYNWCTDRNGKIKKIEIYKGVKFFV